MNYLIKLHYQSLFQTFTEAFELWIFYALGFDFYSRYKKHFGIK